MDIGLVTSHGDSKTRLCWNIWIEGYSHLNLVAFLGTIFEQKPRMWSPVCTDVASYRWGDPRRKQGQGNWKIEDMNVSPETFRETMRMLRPTMIFSKE